MRDNEGERLVSSESSAGVNLTDAYITEILS